MHLIRSGIILTLLGLSSQVLAIPLEAQAEPTLASAAPANGSPGSEGCGRYDLRCWENKQLPPTPGGGSAPTGNAAKQICSSDGREIACSSGDGAWSSQYGCYMKVADPQLPPPGGKTTGAWYQCTWLPGSVTGLTSATVWLEQPPGVDPAQLARRILASIQLQRIDLGMTPGQGKTGLLGLPTYLWVRNAGARTLGPIADAASAGGITVTLTGKVDHLLWSMGDGTTVTCTGAGTPYQDSFGASPSPTCGHVYTRPSTGLPGGAYPVTVTAVWDIAWTGGGQTGAIPFEVTSTGSVRIGEAQALN